MSNIAVFGIYATRKQTENAIEQLRLSGFRAADVSVLLPHNEGTKDFAVTKGSKAPEGAATGAASGAFVGGALGWLAGVGALAIPGIGPFIAAGPLMATLGGLGAGAAVGGLTGGLVGAGIPEYEAKRYEGRIARGGILLSVHADDRQWVERAKNILEATGAEDIASTSESSADVDSTSGDRRGKSIIV